MRYIAAALAGILLLCGCASLMTPSGSAAARWAALEKSRAAKAAGVEGEKICKNMSVMGSNFPQRVCSTPEEWKAFEEEQLKTAEEFDRQRRAGNTGSAFEQ
jgi:hypothetical protein